MHYKNINGTTPAAYARAFARIESHYFVNKGFLNKDNKILDNMHKIDQIPGTIIHGRYDMICPPLSAYKLHNSWEASELHIIENAGHSLSEQGISSALVSVMDDLIQYNRIA
jgi:proline iminopeptidase